MKFKEHNEWCSVAYHAREIASDANLAFWFSAQALSYPNDTPGWKFHEDAAEARLTSLNRLMTVGNARFWGVVR